MRSILARHLLYGAVVVTALGMTGCSEGGDAGPDTTCLPVNGVWDVTLDYGGGYVGHQIWTITQEGCTVTMTADPADLYGPALAGPVTGFVSDGFISAGWETTFGACRTTSRLEATVSGDTMSGKITWVRNGHGAGYCPAAFGEVALTGRLG